jgi:hypothetical protein
MSVFVCEGRIYFVYMNLARLRMQVKQDYFVVHCCQKNLMTASLVLWDHQSQITVVNARSECELLLLLAFLEEADSSLAN